jgi:hypothetical protein
MREEWEDARRRELCDALRGEPGRVAGRQSELFGAGLPIQTGGNHSRGPVPQNLLAGCWSRTGAQPSDFSGIRNLLIDGLTSGVSGEGPTSAGKRTNRPRPPRDLHRGSGRVREPPKSLNVGGQAKAQPAAYCVWPSRGQAALHAVSIPGQLSIPPGESPVNPLLISDPLRWSALCIWRPDGPERANRISGPVQALGGLPPGPQFRLGFAWTCERKGLGALMAGPLGNGRGHAQAFARIDSNTSTPAPGGGDRESH